MSEIRSPCWTRLLVVGDGTTLFQLSMIGLQDHRYTFALASSQAEALALLAHLPFDVIVLDPPARVQRILGTLRALRRAAPTAALLALAEPLRPLPDEAGALCDGHLDKPFGFRELDAGIRAARVASQRRLEQAKRPRRSPSSTPAAAHPASFSTPSGGTPSPRRLALGDFQVDGARRLAWVAGAPLDLTEAEFRLLHCLLVRADEVVDQETLARAVRVKGDGRYDVTLRQLPWYLHQLRRKLEAASGGRTYLITNRSAGYRIAPEGAPDKASPRSDLSDGPDGPR